MSTAEMREKVERLKTALAALDGLDHLDADDPVAHEAFDAGADFWTFFTLSRIEELLAVVEAVEAYRQTLLPADGPRLSLAEAQALTDLIVKQRRRLFDALDALHTSATLGIV